MTGQAHGTFDVTLTPQPLAHPHTGEDAGLGRMSIDKRFHGALDATSEGEMLSIATGVKGSAGYVAIERVTGALGGRHGTFVLQHHATMNRGVPRLTIAVVPDSGTGDLIGLTGTMTIEVAKGQHAYTFDYTLPARD